MTPVFVRPGGAAVDGSACPLEQVPGRLNVAPAEPTFNVPVATARSAPDPVYEPTYCVGNEPPARSERSPADTVKFRRCSLRCGGDRDRAAANVDVPPAFTKLLS